jgi:hypothetical protein
MGSDGCYVARQGSVSSYTRDKYDAQRFATREDAERERCGNEIVVEISLLLQEGT